MPRPFARPCRAVAALSLLATACSYPTDSSTGAWVKVHAPLPVLIRGSDTVLDAHVYVLEHGTDTVEVKNVEVVWATSDPQLLTITPLPGRRARVTGVNPGNVLITATAAAYESAKVGFDTLRVANPLEIDSVRPMKPDTIRLGGELTVYGVGAENADVMFIGSQSMILNSFTGSVNDTTGIGQRRFWVPFPTRSADSVTLIGNAIVSQIFNPIKVIDSVDIYDPNMTSPATIDIDLRPYGSGGTPKSIKDLIAFFNPALFAEEPRLALYRADWFRFATVHPDSAYTFLYIAPQLFLREQTFLSGPVTSATITTGGSWTYGSGRYRCKGWDFNPAEAPSAGFLVAFTKLPPGGADLVSLFIDRGQYELIVLHGYQSSLRPDRFEGNNTCDLADREFPQCDEAHRPHDALCRHAEHRQWLRDRLASLPRPRRRAAVGNGEARVEVGAAAGAEPERYRAVRDERPHVERAAHDPEERDHRRREQVAIGPAQSGRLLPGGTRLGG